MMTIREGGLRSIFRGSAATAARGKFSLLPFLHQRLNFVSFLDLHNLLQCTSVLLMSTMFLCESLHSEVLKNQDQEKGLNWRAAQKML